MTDYTPIKDRQMNGGIQKIYRFPNGYGASVVRHQFSYGADRGLWELGVIKFNGPEWSDFKLNYDTHITSDVLGHLSETDVIDMLKQIEALKEKVNEHHHAQVGPSAL